MMLKNATYYHAADLLSIAKKVPTERELRLRSEALADLLNAIYFRYSRESFNVVLLNKLLGPADAVQTFPGSEIWTYEWVGRHGEEEIRSRTHLQLTNSVVTGFLKDS